MSNESDIPLLQDLLFKGQPDSGNKESEYSDDENKDVEIEQDETNSDSSSEQQVHHVELAESLEPEEELQEELPEELPDDIESSYQQRIVDEEIRRIMEKHMDKAYTEIKKLLKDKIS
ncbi:MAG: hypothetical protein GY744_11555 [Gammaproteobacteria bacterium]|nr:hypothetical protein [Gammaproteobacteria bacterium]